MDKIEILRDLLGRSSTVIFDFDNVIVDSEPYHYEAYARVFAKRGHVINRDEYWLEWTSRGGGAESEIRRYNLDLDPAEIRAEKDPIYSGLCASGAIRPFPAAASVITRLHRRDLSLAIASGSYESDIRTILASCGLDRYFEAIVGKDNVERWKPHPETYLAAAAKLGVPPGRCLAVEDAEKGLRSARGARMRVILIETEITRQLGIAGADLALDGLAEFDTLLAALEETGGGGATGRCS